MRKWFRFSLPATLIAFVLLSGAYFIAVRDGGAQPVFAGREARGDSPGGPSVPFSSPSKHPKIQSSIADVMKVQAESGPEAASGFAAEHGMTVKDGNITVVLESTGSAEGSAESAAALGGTVQAKYRNMVQTAVPIDRLADLAGAASIAYIREPHKPTAFETSEGAADINAPAWHSVGKTGAGVKIAVLDPGFAGYVQRVAEGELPADVITKSFATDGDITGGGTDHGTACAEIVYDVAPGAQLYLVNFSTDVELGNAIDYLVAEGVDVVSASWGFFGDFRGDGQGDINDMVQSAHAGGIYWVNAAGNSAESHWDGAFADGNTNGWTEFTPGDEGNSFYASAGEQIDIYLTWNKWPVTDQDYDVYLFWSVQPSQPVAAGESWQTGSQPPSEAIHYTVPPGKGGTYSVGIKKYSASGDASFQLYVLPYVLEHQVAAGSLGGEPTDSPNALTVGAVAAGTTTLETFSSRGPTLDGRIKPDIVAPDRVSTSTFGPTGFWGTSAATPHAAGAAGLLAGAGANLLGGSSMDDPFIDRSTDLGVPGKDNLYGLGKLDLGSPPEPPPDCGKPGLGLSAPEPFWATYSDYIARQLSINWTFSNTAGFDAVNAQIVGSINTNSVTIVSPLPIVIGDIPVGASVKATAKYLVPNGVSNFRSTTYVTAEDSCGGSYAYPAPYPEI